MNRYVGDQGLAATGTDRVADGGIDAEKHREEAGGFQWGRPNCWPPLMAMMVKGFLRYGFAKEARMLADRWAKAHEKEFAQKGYFPEKISYQSDEKINPGLYQEIEGGFGWTIGEYLAFVHMRFTSGEA